MRFMPRIRALSSWLAFITRTPVSVPRISAADASPIDRTVNGVPNPEACATSARTTSDAETTVRWIVIRLITSDHMVLRVPSRLQCSVARIWARTAGEYGGGGRARTSAVSLRGWEPR